MSQNQPSLFPGLVPTPAAPANRQWTKEDTAKTVADPQFLATHGLADWETKAKYIAAAFDWTSYKSKITLMGEGAVSKRVREHTIRISKYQFASVNRWEIKTTRGGYGVGIHIYRPGDSPSRFARPPKDVCSDEEFAEIHAGFERALDRLYLAGIVPRILTMSGHERMELVEREGVPYQQSLARLGIDFQL